MGERAVSRSRLAGHPVDAIPAHLIVDIIDFVAQARREFTSRNYATEAASRMRDIQSARGDEAGFWLQGIRTRIWSPCGATIRGGYLRSSIFLVSVKPCKPVEASFTVSLQK